MKLTLKIWRQDHPRTKGRLVTYQLDDVSPDMSLLETIDLLNQDLILAGAEPIAFDHDCREGICGSCAMYINGRPHGADQASTTCQLYMRSYQDGDTLTIEPWRANAFPVIRDLMVDRSAFDRIIQAGGYISVNTGSEVDANTIAIPKERAEAAFADAMCIGCGACVAACKNSSAMLFVAAKISHLAQLPQGQPERQQRVVKMVAQMDAEGFGSCSNTGTCAAVCPKEISVQAIAQLNREYLQAKSYR
ncbi:succinate dehydrogenase/fumarate reductase iron-sulfur subunit [Chamaesiphon sp.]|uniref:succinate dehydrogenase/fumarate reductase iron-sulfur subunit n=1 Tax=Chamaesiphon sp. TaxID=2814140 RepID=UPI00359401EE